MDGQFEVGPPNPVTDSRALPAVSAQEEADFVTGADLGPDHPDNVEDGSAYEAELRDTSDDDDSELPSEDDLAELVADIDPDDVDEIGFDASDEEAG